MLLQSGDGALLISLPDEPLCICSEGWEVVGVVLGTTERTSLCVSLCVCQSVLKTDFSPPHFRRVKMHSAASDANVCARPCTVSARCCMCTSLFSVSCMTGLLMRWVVLAAVHCEWTLRSVRAVLWLQALSITILPSIGGRSRSQREDRERRRGRVTVRGSRRSSEDGGIKGKERERGRREEYIHTRMMDLL